MTSPVKETSPAMTAPSVPAAAMTPAWVDLPPPRDEPPRVSLVVPLFNEEATLPELLRRTLVVLDETPGGPHELILCDDGSGDRTGVMIAEAAAADDRVRAVWLSRNFGHQTALAAAMDHAGGDVLLLLDGDLQDRPEELPRFIERWRAGADVVYGVRAARKEGWLLVLVSHLHGGAVDMPALRDLCDAAGVAVVEAVTV